MTPAVHGIGPAGKRMPIRLSAIARTERHAAVSADGPAGKRMPTRLSAISCTERHPAAADPEEGAR
jgi:hypothetical protein